MKRKRSVITGRAAAARTPKRVLRDAAARSRSAPPTRAAEVRAASSEPVDAGPPEPVVVDLRTDLAPTHRGALLLRSPIVVAAGVLGYGIEAGDVFDGSAVGAIVTRTTTRHPRPGNPGARMAEVDGGGLLHALGLPNPGVDAVLERFSRRWSVWDVPVIVSIAAESPYGYGELAELLDGQPGVVAIELNLSCPELARGQDFALDEDAADRATSAARERTDLPLLVKLSAAAPEIRAIAAVVQEAGADAISCSAALPATPIELRGRTRSTVALPAPTALSGPPIRSLVLRAVAEVAQAVRIPVIGIGGVSTLDHVLDLVAAGATAVGVGSAVFADPGLPSRLTLELERYLYEQGTANLAQIRGTALARRKKAANPSRRAAPATANG